MATTDGFEENTAGDSCKADHAKFEQILSENGMSQRPKVVGDMVERVSANFQDLSEIKGKVPDKVLSGVNLDGPRDKALADIKNNLLASQFSQEPSTAKTFRDCDLGGFAPLTGGQKGGEIIR